MRDQMDLTFALHAVLTVLLPDDNSYQGNVRKKNPLQDPKDPLHVLYAYRILKHNIVELSSAKVNLANFFETTDQTTCETKALGRSKNKCSVCEVKWPPIHCSYSRSKDNDGWRRVL